ncbi:sensor histidine kinase [Nocardia barduliensis]|uniref:sensor histidine kinase n=1 Tax=Nocardia barduliensis TaxID=2736643 RepID=UPI001573882F|nr:nitrate- and nitrite sensing domain-containing protein [Nocardia barduliensis]
MAWTGIVRAVHAAGRLVRSARGSVSIRVRVLVVVLIPVITVVSVGAVFVQASLRDGMRTVYWSELIGVQTDNVVDAIISVQAERTASLRALAGDRQAAKDLENLRTKTDVALRWVPDSAPAFKKIDPDYERNVPVFEGMVNDLHVLRRSIDSSRGGKDEVDTFYSRLADMAAVSFDASARSVTDARTAVELTVEADLLRAAELHSRSVGLMSWLIEGGGALDFGARAKYLRLSGGFRSQLEASLPQMTESERQQYAALAASPQWQLVSTADEVLGNTGELPVDSAAWLAAQESIAVTLRALWEGHSLYVAAIAKEVASSQMMRAWYLGAGVLALALASCVVAMVIATGLIRRLRSLRDKTLELADDALPAMMHRLRDGQPVDVDSELVLADHGKDELGQVARAFHSAQRAALSAAAAEAETRGGFTRVFLDIARRSQVLVHQQLAVLDVAEGKQEDPEHLELLFKLDHLAMRARRNAENLLILGGGQPGRKWRRSVPLEEIARSAISEASDFARVNAVRLPEIRVHGKVIADLVHLLAELVDNATSFSPPESPVSVHGNLVGKGVAIEIEDQGLGIRFSERERLNALLASPPEFQQMAAGTYRHLGLFVVGQLARRHGIGVVLTESAYGGVKAIVLLPTELLDPGGDQPQFDRSNDQELDPAVPRHRLFAPLPAVAEPSVSTAPSPVATMHTEQYRPIGNVAARHSRASKQPLPKRRKQSHLASQLRIDDGATQQQGVPLEDHPNEPRVRRSPVNARQTMASLQQGTRQGRRSVDRTDGRNGRSTDG